MKRIKSTGAVMPFLRFLVALALVTAAALPAGAMAASTDPITVKANMARILRISAPAATVIIGNPGVADVTIQDPQTLVLTGKSYGQTNLIVLDSAGNPVADTIVSVVQAPSDMVTMYVGTARNTLSCEPICQQTVTLGDDQTFSATAAGSAALLQSTAK
ncbi:MAG: pilus assembly protein N-terminal domain-containing protein [Devosia sp.]